MIVRSLTLCAVAALLIANSASAALIYSADPPTGGVGSSPASSAPDSGTATHYTDGTGGGGNLGDGYATGVAVPLNFTMAAFVNLDDTSGDNMVFGTTNGAPMHLGFRNNDAYFGFWGNDSGASGGAPLNSWHHFIWSYDSTNGNQDIYRDGALISTSGGHSAAQVGNNIWIASTNGNGGDMNGSLDDIRIYDTASTGASAAALYADAIRSDVPEPSTFALAGLSLVGLLAAYRRRKAA